MAAVSQMLIPAAAGAGGLHPMQAKGLLQAAMQKQKQQQQQQQQQQQHQQHQSQHPSQHPSAGEGIGSGNDSEMDLEKLASTRKLRPSDFIRVRTLGTGTFARVCLVRPANCSDPSKVYALKILRKTEVIRLKQIDHVRSERQLLADVRGHPFVTQLITSFSDHDRLYLLLDYVPGGELFTYLRHHRRFDESWAAFYAGEIVLVLEFLHEQQGGIAYRDLKPENLLLDAEGHIKLVDFGFAKRLGRRRGDGAEGNKTLISSAGGAVDGNDGDDDSNKPTETYTLCGTPEYLAPEVICNKGHTMAVDWWALGILIFEFLTGYPPFWHQNPIEIYRQIVDRPITFPAQPAIGPAAQDIIRQLCTVDRTRRLGNVSGGAARVKAHPFFQGTDWEALLQRRQRGPIIPNIRFPGDARCFDIYNEEDPPSSNGRDGYSAADAARFDGYFVDF